jgi:hypothetical protein
VTSFIPNILIFSIIEQVYYWEDFPSIDNIEKMGQKVPSAGKSKLLAGQYWKIGIVELTSILNIQYIEN